MTIALVVAIALAVGAATLFARADQGARIAADAERLGAIQSSAADTAIHRASLVIAFASLASGTVPQVSLDAADEAVSAVRRMVDRLRVLPDNGPLIGSAQTLLTDTIAVRDLLELGEIPQARSLVDEETVPAVNDLAGLLATEAAVIEGRIAGERDQAGRMARASSFVVALVVPALAVGLFRAQSRRRLEGQRMQAEISRQQELSELKDRMIAGISHELRTPITGIYGWADVMLARPDPAIVAEGAGVILAEAGELRRMVDDIVVMARIGATNLGFRSVASDVVEVIESAVNHHRRLGQHLKIDCEPASFAVDPGRLRQVIVNLVSNGFHHGAGPVEIIGRRTARTYQIAVCDYGTGLGPERVRDPFAPFAHAPGELTIRNSLGMGLATARLLVEGMDGHITYRREENQTVFALSLPTGGAGER